MEASHQSLRGGFVNRRGHSYCRDRGIPLYLVYEYDCKRRPHFPSATCGIGIFGLPYAFLIFPVQLIVALYELFSGKSLGFLLLVIATLNGLLAGFLWSLVLKSSETDTIFVLSLVGVALIQSFVVFGSYWLVDKYALTILNLIQKSVQSRKEMPRTN